MKQLKIAVLSILFTNALTAQNTSLNWAYGAGSGSGPVAGKSIAFNSSGDVYVAGEFSGTVDFDPGPDSTKLSSNGFSSVFVQKLDDLGSLIWAISFGNAWTNVASMVSDDSGNIYLTGSFATASTLDFDPGVDTFNLSSTGSYDVYVLKLTGNGNFIWAKSVGGSDSDESFSMDIATDNVYITGWFEGTADFDPGTGVSNHTSNGWTDIFVLKLDSNGDFVWATTTGGIEQDKGASINIGPAGNVHLTGYFDRTVDFDPGIGTFDLTAANLGWPPYYPDIFIQKLDGDGNFLWAKRMGSHISDEGKAITTDLDGNVFVTGRFSATVDLDPGPDTLNFTSSQNVDHFIQKLDAAGNLLWVKVNNAASAITTDTWGDLYLTGTFQNTEDFDPGVDTLYMSAVGLVDGFIQKLNPSGDLQWALHLAVSQHVTPNAISVADAGVSIVVTGRFLGTIDLDPGPDSLMFTNLPPGVFTLKLNQNIPNTVEESAQLSRISLFPNPTGGRLTIDLGSLIKPIVKVNNLQGELLQEIKIFGTSTLDVVIEGPAGIYIVEIYSADKAIRKAFKIIKY